MLAVQRGLLAGRTRAANTLAIVADPVFDATDPRVTQSGAAASLAPEPVDRSRLLQHLAPSSVEGARAVIPACPRRSPKRARSPPPLAARVWR